MKFIGRMELAIINALIVVIGFLIISMIITLKAESDCLKAGYSKTKVVLITAYCIKRADQTDVVVPLSAIKEQTK